MPTSSDFSPERGQLGAAFSAAYSEFTANVTVSGTTEGNAVLVVTAPSITANGTDFYLVTFFCPQSTPSNADFIIIVLYDNGVFRDRLGTHAATTNNQAPLMLQRRLQATAGAHVFDIRAYRSAANGTLQAGIGGTGVLPPGFINVIKG